MDILSTLTTLYITGSVFSKNTHMVMQFGQFLAHDMADTASQPADCCQQTIR